MPTKTFDLGKRAFAFPINADQDGVLFGQTDHQTDGDGKCTLTLLYKRVRSGTDDPVGESRIVGKYDARSAKFRSGAFDDGEACRYLKSRYRELTRQINACGENEGAAKDQLIVAASEEFLRTHRENAENA